MHIHIRGNTLKSGLYALKFYADDASADDEDMDTLDHKRVKRRLEGAHGKLEKAEPRRSKKKPRVVVEVSMQRSSTFNFD